MTSALAVGSLAALLASASFAFVARSLVARFSRSPDAGPVRAFAVLWGAMAAFMAQRGVLGLAADSGWRPLQAFVVARYAEIVLVCLAAWGMSYYVAYLFTGRRWLRIAFGAYFFLVGVAYAGATAAGRPSSVTTGGWNVGLTPPTPYIDAIYAAFGIPMLVSTLAYATLAGRSISPMQRYRVILTSGSLLAWVGSGLAASIAGDSFWSFVGITLLGTLTAFAVFFAYAPPHFVLRRWARASPAGDRPSDAGRRTAFHARLNELV